MEIRRTKYKGGCIAVDGKSNELPKQTFTSTNKKKLLFITRFPKHGITIYSGGNRLIRDYKHHKGHGNEISPIPYNLL